MATIILEFCPRCLARLSRPTVVTAQSQLDRTGAGRWPCCFGLSQDQANAEYARRLASARVWRTVPETYEITRREA